MRSVLSGFALLLFHYLTIFAKPFRQWEGFFDRAPEPEVSGS